MKKGLLGVLRALAVLTAIWAVLGGVGLVAGVLPLGGGAGASEQPEAAVGPTGGETGSGEAARAEGSQAVDGGPADAGSAEQAAAPETPAETLQRWTVCDAAVRRPSLGAVQVVGSPTPELVVGCDGVVHLLAVVDGAPARIATFDAESVEDAALSVHAAVPAAGDVDGDSIPDLVLPFWQSSRDGSARGGKLYLVRGNATGAFEEGRLLGPIAAVAVALAQLDGQPGLDMVAMNRGSSLARRPSEAWVYTGGAAPVRSAVLRSGLGGNDVAIADLDRDTHLDVIAVASGAPRVDVFFGDGTARFPRSSTVTIADASEAVAVDLDSDGGTDVLVRGEGLQLLHAGPVESLDPRPIDVPAGLTQVRAIDVDGDEKPDLVGLVDGGVVVLPQTGELTFAQAEPRLVAPVVAQRLAVADLDGDSELEAAVLGRAGAEETPWELVLLPSLTDAAQLRGSEEPSTLGDAPLVLRVTLD